MTTGCNGGEGLHDLSELLEERPPPVHLGRGSAVALRRREEFDARSA